MLSAIHLLNWGLNPVVQKVDNPIHQINHYPADSAIGFCDIVHWIVIYAVDSAIQLLNNRGLVVNMSECLLRMHVRNIFHPLSQGV